MITLEDIIEIDITQSQIEEHKTHYPYKAGSLKNSHTKKQEFGAMGEIVFRDFMKENYPNKQLTPVTKEGNNGDTWINCDYLINGKKIEIKGANIGKNQKPRIDWTCKHFKTSSHQKCDYYVFLRIREDFTKAYLLGMISKSDFESKSLFKKKGDYDEDSPKSKPFYYTADTYTLPMTELTYKFKKKS